MAVPNRKEMAHFAKLIAFTVTILTATTAYIVSEAIGGESFWKYLAGLALSVCGVLALLLYNDMRREQLATREEIRGLNRQLLEAEIETQRRIVAGRPLTDQGPIAREVREDSQKLQDLERRLELLYQKK